MHRVPLPVCFRRLNPILIYFGFFFRLLTPAFVFPQSLLTRFEKSPSGLRKSTPSRITSANTSL